VRIHILDRTQGGTSTRDGGVAREAISTASLRLPDPRHADQRDELRRALLAHTVERIADNAQLPLAPDQRRARLQRDVDAEARPRLQRLPDGDPLLLALRLDWVGLAYSIACRVAR